MGDYLQSIIYKLYSPSHPEIPLYYGSSKNPLYKRKGSHKGDYKKGKNSTAFQILCYDDWVMEVVENYSCNNAQELRDRERWWISNNPCVNQRMKPYDKKKADKVYYEEHKEELKTHSKAYYEEHKDECRKQHREYYKQYYEENKEKVKQQKKEWISENRERYLQMKREAYQRRKQKLLESEGKK
jgi:hypothetical protein